MDENHPNHHDKTAIIKLMQIQENNPIPRISHSQAAGKNHATLHPLRLDWRIPVCTWDNAPPYAVTWDVSKSVPGLKGLRQRS